MSRENSRIFIIFLFELIPKVKSTVEREEEFTTGRESDRIKSGKNCAWRKICRI